MFRIAQLEKKYPNRLYFKIDEVAKYLKVPVTTLRYWCNEFDELNVRKNGKGDRHFTKDDILTARYIRQLLKDNEYTIQGAKNILAKKGKHPNTQKAIIKLENLKLFLKELKSQL